MYIAGDGAVGVTADNGGARWRWSGLSSTADPGTRHTPGLHTRPAHPPHGHGADGLPGTRGVVSPGRQNAYQ